MKPERILDGSIRENSLERFFKMKERNTNVKTEVLAGITTFLTCTYIIAVNPAILSSTGMDAKAIFWATAICAGFGSIAMGLYANFPFAIAPAMGLNAYFAYYVVGTMGIPWRNALACVLISGCLFLLMSLFKVRETIVNQLPHCVKHSVGAGIGFFIAFIGMNQSGIIVASESTLIQMGDLRNPGTLLALLGVALTVFLVIKGIKGGILIGILGVTIAGLFVTNPATGMTYSQFPTGGIFAFDSPFEALAPTFGQLTFHGLFSNFDNAFLGILFIIFSFFFVDLFDGIGVLVGVSTKAGFMDEKGELPNAGKALLVDAGAATASGIFGTSITCIFGAESTTGIAEGGRTGLVAVVTGLLFLLALFLSPLFLMIPPIATAPALIMVGVFMIEPLKNIKLDDLTEAFPAFLAIAMMAFTSSIAHGIIYAVLGYTLAKLAAKRLDEISITTWVLTAIFLIYVVCDALL